ncbi:hypothetical protein ABEB36_012828 [Hypothenemus hampei]|uniref:THAP-type domain-containing protein n=1 Tax=Hypothenemus hampei TaxID=57062 RepID=A0ABD1E8N2_HYPHA
MPINCLVCGEVRNNKSIISFHRIPKEQVLRKKWLTACRLEEHCIKTNSVICSKHFRIDDFDETYWPQRRLKLYAVPAPSFSSFIRETQESPSSLPSCSNALEMLRSPRYVGDFKAEHFATPKRAKRRLSMLTDVIESQRKKIRALQTQNHRMQKRIKSFRELLKDLREKQILNEYAYEEILDLLYHLIIC